MEQGIFEQTVLAALHDIPAKHRESVVQIVQTLARKLRGTQAGDETRQFNPERHRAVRQLTATISGSMAAAVSVERDERS